MGWQWRGRGSGEEGEGSDGSGATVLRYNGTTVWHTEIPQYRHTATPIQLFNKLTMFVQTFGK
jgi:hypothetical protein